MTFLRKIKNFLSRYCLDDKFRSKVNVIPESILILIGFITKKYSLILYGILIITLVSALIKTIVKMIVVKKIKKSVSSLSQNIVLDDLANDENTKKL